MPRKHRFTKFYLFVRLDSALGFFAEGASKVQEEHIVFNKRKLLAKPQIHHALTKK